MKKTLDMITKEAKSFLSILYPNPEDILLKRVVCCGREGIQARFSFKNSFPENFPENELKSSARQLAWAFLVSRAILGEETSRHADLPKLRKMVEESIGRSPQFFACGVLISKVGKAAKGDYLSLSLFVAKGKRGRRKISLKGSTGAFDAAIFQMKGEGVKGSVRLVGMFGDTL